VIEISLLHRTARRNLRAGVCFVTTAALILTMGCTSEGTDQDPLAMDETAHVDGGTLKVTSTFEGEEYHGPATWVKFRACGTSNDGFRVTDLDFSARASDGENLHSNGGSISNPFDYTLGNGQCKDLGVYFYSTDLSRFYFDGGDGFTEAQWRIDSAP
jgi:hypothetical protein